MRRIRKNKKAMVFPIFVVIFTIAALTYGYVRLSEKQDIDRHIGENQFEVIGRIQQGESAMMFLDLSAKMALQQAVYDLHTKGGITQTTACGSYYGFNMWNSPDGEQCHVDSVKAKESLKE